MKKRLLFAALFSAALVSCTKDQVVEVQQDEIKFRVATENATKAADVYCAKNMIPDFTMYASYYTDGTTGYKPYIDGKSVTVANDNSASFTNGSYYYWPNGTDDKLDFFAVKNGTITNFSSYNPSANPAVMPSVSFTVKGNITNPVNTETVANQLDLVYAVKKAQTKTAEAVELNFRHALSQVEFNAKKLNENIYVEVSGVKVMNVQGTGTFTFPYENTDGQIIDHNQDGKVDPDNTADVQYTDRNNWTANDGKEDYEVGTHTGAPIVLTSTAASITTNTGEYSERSMLLIPQTRAAWDKTSEPTGKGVCFAVKCKIWNIAGESVDKDNDVVLHDGYAYIPVSIKWEEGKKYIYTFVFDKNGNGGYNPDGTEVLTPISLEVTVDDFTKKVESDLNM